MSRLRILVVDDEEGVREAYREIFDSAAKQKKTSSDNQADAFFKDQDDGVEEVVIDTPDMNVTYEVDYVSQGKDAVKHAKDAHEEGAPYAVIFLDMRMPPGIGGLEVSKQIREFDQEVEIVVMTAYSDYKYSELVAESGCPEHLMYFHKPFHIDQILQLSYSLTQRWSRSKVQEGDAGSSLSKSQFEKVKCELRTSLAIILGEAEFLVLSDDLVSPFEIRKSIRNVYRSSQRLHSLIAEAVGDIEDEQAK